MPLTLDQIELVLAGRSCIYWIILWNNTDLATYNDIATEYEGIESGLDDGTLTCDGIIPSPARPRPTTQHP
jgi:hypothetical protein